MTNKLTSQHTRGRRSPGSRFSTVLLAVVLLASACGSDSNDAEGSFADNNSGNSNSNQNSGSANTSNNSNSGAVITDDADSAFAPSENTTQDGSRVDTAEPDADGGGLFGTVDDEQPAATTAPVDSRFTDYGIRTFVDVRRDPLSTFALDVDTGSYTIARRHLEEGTRPPRESVRVEEFVNAFDYDYSSPRSGLDVVVDGAPSPFDEDNYLIRVGVQAAVVDDNDRDPVSLTFVVDTSGSMDSPDRLGLVKQSLSLLVDQLERDDTVAIVTYSGGSGIVLEPTEVRDRREILDAIDGMRAGGSTNLQAGLDEGYDLAARAFREDGVNRVIVASDGLANAGITDVDRLAERIRRDADDGIALVTVGYGLDGFNDTTMEQLADQGDGFYAYVDTIEEAERLFRDELTSTLITAAIDAKIQVEFDDRYVDEYRLIGYENRGVLDQDFRNDDVDAGELGAGHQATAIYEVRLASGLTVDDRAELGVVRLRWEDPETGEVAEIDEDVDLRDIEPNWRSVPADLQQAVVVATFAELLRENPYADDVDIDNLFDEAKSLRRDIDTDAFDELVDLIDAAR